MNWNDKLVSIKNNKTIIESKDKAKQIFKE